MFAIPKSKTFSDAFDATPESGALTGERLSASAAFSSDEKPAVAELMLLPFLSPYFRRRNPHFYWLMSVRSWQKL